MTSNCSIKSCRGEASKVVPEDRVIGRFTLKSAIVHQQTTSQPTNNHTSNNSDNHLWVCLDHFKEIMKYWECCVDGCLATSSSSPSHSILNKATSRKPLPFKVKPVTLIPHRQVCEKHYDQFLQSSANPTTTPPLPLPTTTATLPSTGSGSARDKSPSKDKPKSTTTTTTAAPTKSSGPKSKLPTAKAKEGTSSTHKGGKKSKGGDDNEGAQGAQDTDSNKGTTTKKTQEDEDDPNYNAPTETLIDDIVFQDAEKVPIYGVTVALFGYMGCVVVV